VKAEYDFSKGERGRFYRHGAKINLPALAESVRFTGDVIHVRLDDGREISLPLNEVAVAEMAGESHAETARELVGGAGRLCALLGRLG
jgi:hypothetical protein